MLAKRQKLHRFSYKKNDTKNNRLNINSSNFSPEIQIIRKENALAMNAN